MTGPIIVAEIIIGIVAVLLLLLPRPQRSDGPRSQRPAHPALFEVPLPCTTGCGRLADPGTSMCRACRAFRDYPGPSRAVVPLDAPATRTWWDGQDSQPTGEYLPPPPPAAFDQLAGWVDSGIATLYAVNARDFGRYMARYLTPACAA